MPQQFTKGLNSHHLFEQLFQENYLTKTFQFGHTAQITFKIREAFWGGGNGTAG